MQIYLVSVISVRIVKSMNSQTVKDIGYFILRFGLGALMARHGWPKITGGTEMWADVGSGISVIGITFWPTVWGFCAAVAEFVGGICVAVGFLHRPACGIIVFTMFIAFLNSFGGTNTFGDWNHVAELGIAFLGMLLMGPGRFSLSVSVNK